MKPTAVLVLGKYVLFLTPHTHYLSCWKLWIKFTRLKLNAASEYEAFLSAVYIHRVPRVFGGPCANRVQPVIKTVRHENLGCGIRLRTYSIRENNKVINEGRLCRWCSLIQARRKARLPVDHLVGVGGCECPTTLVVGLVTDHLLLRFYS